MGQRQLWLAITAMASAQAAVYIARPLTSYRLLGLGGDARQVGLVAAAYAVLPLFLAIPLGRFADRRNPAPLIVIGCAAQTVACCVLSVAQSTSSITAANALLGLGHLGLALGVQHLIARESSGREHDRRFAAFTVGVSAGQLVGPAVAGAMLSARGSTTLAGAAGHGMLVAAGFALLATSAAALSSSRKRVGVAPMPVGEPGRVREIAVIRGVPAGIFASIAVLSSADVLTAYLPVLGQHRGIDPGVIGVLLAIRAGASMVARIGIVRLVRHIGRLRLIAGSTLLAAAAVVLLTTTGNAVLLALLMAAAGYGLGFSQPLTMTMVIQRVPRHWAASALAVRLTGNRLGQVAAPALAGILAGGAGVASVFWLLGGLLFASVVAVQRPALLRDEQALLSVDERRA
jgi:MFS family permease